MPRARSLNSVVGRLCIAVLATGLLLTATGCPRKAARVNLSRKEAMEAFAEQEYDKAVQKFTEAIQLNPEDAEVYHLRGLANHELHRIDDAIVDQTEAIRLNPDYAAAYFERGNIYWEKNQSDLAQADFKKADQLNPVTIDTDAPSANDVVIGGEDDFVGVPISEKHALIEINKAVPHVNYSYHKGGSTRTVRNILLEKGVINDKLLTYVAALPNITSLTINSDGILDADIDRIKRLYRLERFVLISPRMTDKVIPYIQKFPNLKSLTLKGRGITNESVAGLMAMPKLETLNLAMVSINDDGFATLAGMKQLKQLGLSQSNITDEGLKAIAKAPNLEKLFLSNTKGTDEGIAGLTKLNPKLQVYRTDIDPVGVSFRKEADPKKKK